MYIQLPSEVHTKISDPANFLSPFFLTVDPPKITRHPESKSVATGASTTFTIEASGDGLCFQWMKDCKDLRDGNKYCDTGTHTLHIVNMEKSDNKAHYRCLVKNEIGEEFSKDALFTVSKLVINVVDVCLQKLSQVTKFIV